MRSILLSAIIFLASCASNPGAPVLQLPPKLNLPTIVPSDLYCLPDEAYESLVVRDVMQSRRIETLRSIIKATHK